MASQARIKFLKYFLLLTSCFGFSDAFADNARTAYVQAYTGLQPVLSLSCTDVDFSVWRVPVRQTGDGQTTISLTAAANRAGVATLKTVGGDSLNIARVADYEDAVAGTCVVQGSHHPNQQIRVTISNNKNLALGGVDRGPIKRPKQAAAVKVDLQLMEDFVVIDSTGRGTFRVIGIMTLPPVITVDNYGAYSAAALVADNLATITVIDTPLP